MTALINRKVEPPRGLFFGEYSLVFSGDMPYVTHIRRGIAAAKNLDNVLMMHAEAIIRFQRQQVAAPYVTLPAFLGALTLSGLPPAADVIRLFAEHKTTLSTLANVIAAMPANQVRVVYSYSNLKVYANDEQLIESVAAVPGFSNVTVRQIARVLPHNHYGKAKLNSKYRTFMRSDIMAPTVAQTLYQYLAASTELVVSQAFMTELKRPRPRTNNHFIRSHYYIDYNDPKELGFLQLIAPGLLGRTITFEEIA